MNASRNGYEALEALPDEEITDEQRRLLEDRARRSPEWEEAIRAHQPPAEALKERIVDRLMEVAHAGEVIRPSFRSRSLAKIAGVGAGLAASIAIIIALDGRTVPAPVYAARKIEEPISTSCQLYRGGGTWALSPPNAHSVKYAVCAFSADGEVDLCPDARGSGVFNVHLKEDVRGKVLFVVGPEGDLPGSLEEAKLHEGSWSVVEVDVP